MPRGGPLSSGEGYLSRFRLATGFFEKALWTESEISFLAAKNEIRRHCLSQLHSQYKISSKTARFCLFLIPWNGFRNIVDT